MSLGVEPRLINKNKFLTHIGHAVQDIIMLLLKESGLLIPLLWNGSDGLPGDFDWFEGLLDGRRWNLNIEFGFNVFSKLFECSAWVLLKQQENGGDHVGR